MRNIWCHYNILLRRRKRRKKRQDTKQYAIGNCMLKDTEFTYIYIYISLFILLKITREIKAMNKQVRNKTHTAEST